MKWICWVMALASALLILVSRLPNAAPWGPGLGPAPGIAFASPASAPAIAGFKGAGSCSAAACHGGNGAPGSRGSEHTTWIVHDRHARAYAILYETRSQDMAKKLGLGAAHKARLCLQCHVHPGAAPSPDKEDPSFADGVSCEACHGPAEHWIDKHQRWKRHDNRDAKKLELGMRLTKDLRTRGQICLDCHVGSDKADVNHDLLAAGHPELRFELSAYHAAMPKHWSAHADKENRPEFEARLWLLGQLSAAQRALQVLAVRAEASSRDDPQRPWPEFAEHRCAACHHRLSPEADPTLNEARRRGHAEWNSWYGKLLPELEAEGWVKGSLLSDGYAPLRKSMSERVRPKPEDVLKVAREVEQLLSGAVDDALTSKIDPGRARLMLKRLSGPATAPALTWDAAAQRYLGLAALVHALGDMKPDEPGLDEMRRSLGELRCELDKWATEGDRGPAARRFTAELRSFPVRLEK